ncbi:efflux RND transporter periplasmic adaptor subunit [Salegentibacter echinorum]|nr:efflux RND transporter periplasmic adaptor subunit [Salegentibacter echinorum]
MKNNIQQQRTMKKLAFLISIPILIVSCGKNEQSVEKLIENGNLSEIRNKKSELSKEQSELNAKIDRLDEAIHKLDKSKRLDLVTTHKIGDTLFKHYAEVQGDVTTNENIIIYPEYSGILSEVRVKEGQNIKKGQVLAKIDDGGLSSELAQLETNANLAKTTYERQKRLWDQNIGSEIQYLETKANYEGLKSSVNRLKAQLEKTVVRAPFSGIIDEVFTEEGEVVSPGQNRLFQLVNLSDMYIKAEVPESYLNHISKGTEVLVDISSLNKDFEGKIRRVGNTINPNNRSFTIEVAIPNEQGKIKPNQIATLKLNDYTAENAMVVPENALLKNAKGESVVFVIEEETGENEAKARRVIVETGYSYKDMVEITSGLEPQQTLILEGAKNLRDGQKVKIRN